jgi:hypothetical protein
MTLRWIRCLAFICALPAWAESARFAVLPLEAQDFSPAERSTLQGLFEVAMGRVPRIALAGRGQVEAALVKGCADNDACLRTLAEQTESLYVVQVRVQRDPQGKELNVRARVVRVNGEVARKISLNAPVLADVGLASTASELLTVLTQALELGRLTGPTPAALDAVVESAPAPKRVSPGMRKAGAGAVPTRSR